MNFQQITSMEKWIIKAPKGAEYLSDFLTEIPVNCLFNKKKQGAELLN